MSTRTADHARLQALLKEALAEAEKQSAAARSGATTSFAEIIEAVASGETLSRNHGDALGRIPGLTANQRRILSLFYSHRRGTLSLANLVERERTNDLWIDMLEARQMRVDGTMHPDLAEAWTAANGRPEATLEEVRALLCARLSDERLAEAMQSTT